MKLDGGAISPGHCKAFTEFAERLATTSIAIFEHHFDYLCFGSWVVVAGSRHRRVRLTWDGRESSLVCEAADFVGSSAPARWQEVEIRSAANPEDAALLRRAANRDRLAKALASALEDHFGQGGKSRARAR